MRPTIKSTAFLSALAIVLAGCSTTWDPHAPKTVRAGDGGGSLSLKHGQRLYIPLAADPNGGYEWHRVEPPVVVVVPDGPARPEGMQFTPVRTGSEKLAFEYRPVAGGESAQTTVSYDVTVR